MDLVGDKCVYVCVQAKRITFYLMIKSLRVSASKDHTDDKLILNYHHLLPFNSSIITYTINILFYSILFYLSLFNNMLSCTI